MCSLTLTCVIDPPSLNRDACSTHCVSESVKFMIALLSVLWRINMNGMALWPWRSGFLCVHKASSFAQPYAHTWPTMLHTANTISDQSVNFFRRNGQFERCRKWTRSFHILHSEGSRLRYMTVTCLMYTTWQGWTHRRRQQHHPSL